MNSLMNFEDLSIQELQVMQERIVSIRMKKLEVELEETKSLVKKQSKEIEIIKEENRVNMDLEIKRHRLAEHRFGYIGLSDLGKQYDVAIGAKTMGTLLRLVGIAKAKQSTTEPYSEAIINGLAKTVDSTFGNTVYKTYQWNAEKCIAKIDRWLDKHNHIDQFYSIDNEKDLMRFIQSLEEMYS